MSCEVFCFNHSLRFVFVAVLFDVHFELRAVKNLGYRYDNHYDTKQTNK